MALVRFTGGAWDGTDRDELPIPEAGDMLLAEDDGLLGYYIVQARRLPQGFAAELSATWHYR